MHIGAKPRIVGEVPPRMIGVVVNQDVVAVPKPVTYVVIIVGRNLEVVIADVKPLSVAAQQAIDAVRADGFRKASVFPGTIEMVMRIVAACVMSYPSASVRVNVRSFRMFGLIAIAGRLILLRANLARRTFVPRLLRSTIGLSRRSGRSATSRGRTVWRNVAVTYGCRLAAMLLCPMFPSSAGLGRLRLRASALLVVTPPLSKRENRKNNDGRNNAYPLILVIHAQASIRGLGYCTLQRWTGSRAGLVSSSKGSSAPIYEQLPLLWKKASP